MAISKLFYIFVDIKDDIISNMEWNWNRTYTKTEIAEIYFPQFSHKYAWGLIADLCRKQGELPGVFRSNRRYVLPSELRIIVNALNQ